MNNNTFVQETRTTRNLKPLLPLLVSLVFLVPMASASTPASATGSFTATVTVTNISQADGNTIITAIETQTLSGFLTGTRFRNLHRNSQRQVRNRSHRRQQHRHRCIWLRSIRHRAGRFWPSRTARSGNLPTHSYRTHDRNRDLFTPIPLRPITEQPNEHVRLSPFFRHLEFRYSLKGMR